MTGTAYPWGRLQGVRPGKLFHRLLDMGLSFAEAEHQFRASYGVSEEKAQLMRDVAEIERPILVSARPVAVSVYVGIPFCPTRCLYCSFPSHSLSELGRYRAGFVKALIQEINAVGCALRSTGRTVDSVYVGGGTPTALTADELGAVLDALHESLPQPWLEFTVEAGRPETITDGHLDVLQKRKVGRISINPQTKHDATLQLIGRQHRAAAIEAALARAQAHQIGVTNMDLILGLPGENAAKVAASVDWVLGMRPENITLHMFSPKRASRFTEEQDGIVPLLPDETTATEMSRQSYVRLRQDGYQPYYLYRQRGILGGQENVGWSLPGNVCRYNVLMIEERQDIVGLGGGATSKLINRDLTLVNLANPKDAVIYIDRVNESINQKVKLLSERSPRL